MKKILVLILILLLVTSCKNDSADVGTPAKVDEPSETEVMKVTGMEEIPKIKVSHEGDMIQTVERKVLWNGVSGTNPYILKTYMDCYNDNSLTGLNYLELGEDICIEFEAYQPETIELKESLMTEAGERKYDVRCDQERNISLDEEGCYSFTLSGSFADVLSSNSNDYLPGHTYKGYTLLCTWADGEYQAEYGFVIRSDASITLN